MADGNRFTNTPLQKWKEQADSPVAPAGMKQAAQAAAGYEGGRQPGDGNRFATSALGQWVSESGYTEAGKTWFTGQNREGVTNGWDTDFWQRADEQNQRYGEQGKLNVQFEQPDATGVVTWDHASSDGKTQFHFGDVYDQGKLAGNVFKQFDAPTANLMMADQLFTREEKTRLFSEGGGDQTKTAAAIEAAVTGKRELNNTEIPRALSARGFQDKVDTRAEDYTEGHVDDAIVAGSAVGSAAVGAGAGAVVGSIVPIFGTGVGALVGGIAGFLGGAAGAEMNKDALAQQAARAYEITSMSNRENGGAAAFATGVNQWAGFSGKLMAPLSNLTQGLADVTRGNRGDGRSEFYRVDDQGHSSIPKWLKAADVVASVGDAAMQFASPIGKGMYTVQMSSTILGEVGELGATGGKSFDYSRGGFDNIFTDDKGQLDKSSALAGLGKIGIDVVQLGMVHGLAAKADASGARGLFNKEGSAYGTGRLRDRMPTFLGGRTTEQKAALAAGGRDAEAAGFRFTLDAQGKVVGGKRATLSILAPSEQLTALSARVQATRFAAKRQATTVSADDFYRAASAMATGERVFKTALINGMGEGYEEAVQAILEPHSHNESISMGDVGNAALYGFAMGTGMGLGIGARMPSVDEKLMHQAYLAQAMRTGVGPDIKEFRKTWKGKTETEKRAASALSNLERATTDAAYKKLANDMTIERAAGFAGTAKLRDAISLQLASNLARATDRTDGAFVIAPVEDTGRVDAYGNLLPGAMPGDAMVASAFQTVRNLADRMRGHEVQQAQLERDLAKVTADLAAAPGDEDLTRRQAETAKNLDQVIATLQHGNQIVADLDARLDVIYDGNLSVAEVTAEIETLNETLRNIFHERLPSATPIPADQARAMSRAVSMLMTRDPQDQSGSYQVLVPQISVPLTISNSDNLLQIPAGILAGISGDYDGDKMRAQNQLILSEEDWISARSGSAFLGAGNSVAIKAPKDEDTNIELMSQALAAGGVLGNYATGVLTSIGGAVKYRYRNVVDLALLDRLLEKFYAEARANNKEARSALVDGLAREAGAQITEYARGNLSNEWLWLDHLLRSNVQLFQETYSAHRPQVAPEPNSDVVLPNRQSADVRERRIEHAATIGNTAGLLLAGDTPFRQAQKLHYSSLVAAVLSSQNAGGRTDIAALAQLYEALGQGLTRTELEEVRAKDEITGRVYARLKRVSAEAQRLDPSLGSAEALAVIANVRISDISYDANTNEWSSNGDEITLAQFLLRQSVDQDRNEKDRIFDASPELQAKHARLRGMTFPPRQGRDGSRPVNAQRAFIEIVGSQQLYALLGDAANVFGPHLTVEQWIRGYVSLDENSRRSADNQLRGEPEYFGRKKSTDIPYGLDEIAAKEITAYRALVDSMLAVGHNRITIDTEIAASTNLHDRHLNGELAQRHYATSKAFQDAHTRAREALFAYAGLDPRSGKLDAGLVARMLESNPDFAHQVMALIPADATNVVLENRADGVHIANWVYDMFVMGDAAEAEVHLWRNLLFTEWNARGLDFNEEGEEGATAVEFHKLTRRSHRILFKLAMQAKEDGGLLYDKFITEAEEATSMEGLLRWINTTPGIRGGEAPIVGWVDDVAEFDADKASGGWTKALAGSELREAISALQTGASNLVKDIASEQASIDADVSLISAIRRHLAGTGTTDDAELHRRLEQRIKDAEDMAVGLGPQAMLYEIIGAVRGFYPQAHTKGKNPAHVATVGAFEAQRDAFDYVTNYERVLAAMTAVNLDAVGGNMSQVAKDSGRSMDDHGRPVTWGKATVENVLDLMENPDTRAGARAMLFPQVQERTFDGRLSTQMLVGKSLNSLLNGDSYGDLYPKADGLRLDPALRYAALLNAEARSFGGQSALMRAATDLVVARSSASGRQLSDYDLEQMTVKAIHELVQQVQLTGSILSEDQVRGTDSLTPMLAQVRAAQRKASTASRLGVVFGDNGDLTDAVVTQLVQAREKEGLEEQKRIADSLKGVRDPEQLAFGQRRIDALIEEVARFKEQIDTLLAGDLMGRAMTLYAYPDDPAAQPAARRTITDFIMSNLHMLETSSASLITLGKLTEQMLDSGRNGNIELTDKEWAELSGAVIGVFLDQQTSSTAAGISVAPFPGEDHADDRRYYDTTFSYLAEPVLDPASPLVRAAAKLHDRAGRFGHTAYDVDVYSLLDRTLFAEFSLGAWTSDIPRASIEANQRLLSSPAEAAIAMAGNSPKRQSVISAATRRTFQVPGVEHLSVARLSYVDLAGSPFAEFTMQQGGQVVDRPLAHLNNRFARTAQLVFPDGNGDTQAIDLLVEYPNLGRPFFDGRAAGAQVEGVGLQEINLERLALYVERHMTAAGADVTKGFVEVAFVDPDLQPAGPEWMNNVFFEGTNFSTDGDQYGSLNAGLWFSPNGLNQTFQRAALDASKEGRSALEVVPVATSEEVAAYEANFTTDFAGMLRAKAKHLFDSELGFGQLDPAEFYNAVMKDLKLRHFVRGTADGVPVLWTAEQAIAHHAANPGTALPIENPTLWIPTDDVLRSLLGEQGTQGVRRVFDQVLEVDPDMVPTWRGVTAEMRASFAAGLVDEAVALHQTRVLNRARQQQLMVRAKLDDVTREAYDTRMRYRAVQQQAIHAARSEWSGQTGKGGFSPHKNMARVLKYADSMLRAENIAFDWAGVAGIPFVGPRKITDTAISKMLLRDLEATLVNNGSRAGWILRENGDALPSRGELTGAVLDGALPEAQHIALGDLVVVELDSFRGDWKKAEQRMQYLTSRGATIALGSGDGTTGGRAEMAELLDSLNYERIAGSKHVYQPMDFSSRFANQRARISTLTEMRRVSKRNHLAILNVVGKGIQEGGAFADHDNPRLKAIAVQMNLVPTDFLAGYNVPVAHQLENALQQLRSLNTDEGLAHLRTLAGDATFDSAWAALMRRVDDNRLLPVAGESFGTGDFVPLIDGRGSLLLYRHGMRAPRRDQVDVQLKTPYPGEVGGVNVAIFGGKPEEAATTHIGTVAAFNPRSGYGLSVELEIDLQAFGDKKVLEWNGMKYILTPRPAGIEFPDHGFFKDWGFDLVVDTPGVVSKEAFDGLINNHRNAFAYLGIDFTKDAASFFGVDERQAVQMLNAIAQGAERIPLRAAHELMNAPRPGTAFLSQMAEVAAAMSATVDPGWLSKFEDAQGVDAQIVRAMLIYLSTPGAQVTDILRSGGFNDDSAGLDGQSQLMPRLFTQVFDNAEFGSALRLEMNRRFNEQLYNPHTAQGMGYSIGQDFQIETRHPDPTKRLRGHLQFAEVHSAGDNPFKNGMSYDVDESQAVSAHSGAIAHQSIGARTASRKDIAKARAFAAGKGVTRLQPDNADGGAWRMLNNIDASSGQRWRAQAPAEAARRSLAREAVVRFRRPISKTVEEGWDAASISAYSDVALHIVHTLHLKSSQVGVVDFWVRQMLGTDLDANRVTINPRAALEAAKDIAWNVERGYLPTVTAMVPLTHVHDLQLIYRANRNMETGKRWAPRTSMDADATRASAWNDWVTISLGSAFTGQELFDPLYLLALDGFMHTYQAATRQLMDLPVSMDSLKAVDLLLPDTQDMLASVDPNQNLLDKNPTILDMSTASLDDMIGGQRIAGVYESKRAPASEIAKKRDAIRKWRKENDIPLPVDTTMRNFVKNGSQFVHHSTTTNAMVRGLINLRVGTAMLNPALYVSMGPEQWVRGTLDRAANLITGQSTAGGTAALAAKVGLSRYTPEQLAAFRGLYENLGQRKDFKAMVYADLHFLRPHEPGIGRFEKILAGYAKFGSRMQDPTWGMRATTLARRYLEAALSHIEMMPTETNLTPEMLVAHLMRDPQYLKNHHPEVHESAANSIAQLRSLRTTVLSSAIRGMYEPLSTSSHAGRNIFGNLVLKMPLIFSGYAMNVLTTITGLQGLDAVAAASLHGRSKGPGSFFGRIQAAMRGDEFNPETDAQFDMSSVMDGLDLSRAFIRGGLTHTALFMFGMAAGGLGLSGEDDEAKKRRRLAKLQGAGYTYGPNELENDFRNQDAIFMDWLPFGSKLWGAGEDADGNPQSIGQLHWTLKQFISPLLGFERFYETGDFRQVTWGFQDALGSFPLINTLMWDDVVKTGDELLSAAQAEAEGGTPVNQVNSAHMVTNIVGTYERMLFENAFVNQLYTSFDKYDRDPYKLPLRDSDGTLQRDIEGNARANNLSVEQYIAENRDRLTREIAGGQWEGQLYVDPENGEIKQGYMGRDPASAQLHALTENRASLAFLMSMGTGFLDSDYLRRNMPIKTQSIEKPVVSADEARAIVQALSTGQRILTPDEMLYLVKGEAMRTKNWGMWNNADAIAAENMKQVGLDPLSVLDAKGREVLTHAGADAVFTGLVKGSVKLGDASLMNVTIPYEMRVEIQKQWTKQLVQEGLDLGLDQTKATSRMKRLWNGPLDNPDVKGLGDILWDKGIDYQSKVTYNQLNTTYVMGPDGRPWATGFHRDGLLGALGLKPIKAAYTSTMSSMSTDARLNSTDYLGNMNTGMRALERVDDSRYIPTDVEIGKSIEDAIKEAAKGQYTPFKPYSNSGGPGSGYRRFGNGWRNYGRRKYGHGGGGYSGGGGYFTKMYSLPGGESPYGNNIPFINTSNPLIRRGDVRRERVWSERGRLKQWQ